MTSVAAGWMDVDMLDIDMLDGDMLVGDILDGDMLDVDARLVWRPRLPKSPIRHSV